MSDSMLLRTSEIHAWQWVGGSVILVGTKFKP
jgi:hypothetical protein